MSLVLTRSVPNRQVIRIPYPPEALRRLLLVLALGFCALSVLAFGLRWVAVGRPLLLGFVSATPYLGLLGAVGLALVAFCRRPWLAVAGTVLLVAQFVVQAPLLVAADAPAGGHRIVVLTANLKLGQADPSAVVAAVRRDDVAVFVAEELTPELADGLRAHGLMATLPYSAAEPRPRAAGTGIWSRFPLSDVGSDPAYTFEMITARLAVPGLPYRPEVVGLHLAGPVPDSTLWRRDIARLPETLNAQPKSAPVLVAGDFNATRDTAQFRRVLRTGYVDAADQAGAGITATFPADRWYGPLIAIDHVLTRGAVARRVRTVSISDSDHRGLLVSVALPGGSKSE
jgi:endonuclease/exonuclease/phosphatase (EEP) superfamily protein YafD